MMRFVTLPSDLETTLKSLATDLRAHYGVRYGELILCAPRREQYTLEVMLVLEGEVNQMREILRTEPAARKHSNPDLEIAVLPVSRDVFDRALEPELWELRFTGSVIEPD
jgi:hypothetical protein